MKYLIKVSTLFFRYAIAHLIDYSINITYMHWKTKKFI